MKRAEAERLLDRFEVVASNHDALGSIPVFSDDAEEQRLINFTRRSYKSAYTRTRNRLLKLLETASV